MADDEEAEIELEKSTGGKKKIIIIALAALVLIGGAIGGTLFVVGGSNDDSETSAEAASESEVEVDKGYPTYVDLKPPFTVNLSPDDPVGFLQISLQVLTYSDDVAEQLEKHKPLIRNNLVVLFGKQNSNELRAPEGKAQLQKSILEVVQMVIDKYGTGGEIENVFFTNFVMQ